MLILPLLLSASVSSPEGEGARADDSQGPTTADMLRVLGSSLVPIPPSRALEPNFRNFLSLLLPRGRHRLLWLEPMD